MLISQEQIENLVQELGISITEKTTPVELFDTVKKLIVEAINSIDQGEIYKRASDDLGRDVRNALTGR